MGIAFSFSGLRCVDVDDALAVCDKRLCRLDVAMHEAQQSKFAVDDGRPVLEPRSVP